MAVVLGVSKCRPGEDRPEGNVDWLIEGQVKARMSDSKRVQSGGFVAFVRLQTPRTG